MLQLVVKNDFVSTAQQNSVEIRRFLMRLASGVKKILVISIEYMSSSFGGFYKVNLCDGDIIYPNVFFSLEQLKSEIDELAYSYNLSAFYINRSVNNEIVI